MVNLSRVKRSFIIGGVSLILLIGFGFMLPLSAYEVISVEKGGALFGTIKFKGNPPSSPPQKVLRDYEFCGSTVQEETYLVHPENQGLQNVVISIEEIQKGKKPLISPLVIDNLHCHFFPHVQAGMVGETYEIRNLDSVMHNTHVRMEESTLVNVALPPGGRNIKKTALQKGFINLKCDAHKFMQGWLVVTDNPYFAVTDQEGNYRISDIPAGKYKIKIWHEGLPLKEKEVTIFPDKKTELSMDLTFHAEHPP